MNIHEMEKQIYIRVKIPDGSHITLTANLSNIVLDVKKIIEHKVQLPINKQILYYQGKILIDEFTLHYYKVNVASTFILVNETKSSKNASKAKDLFQQYLKDLQEVIESGGAKYDLLISEIQQLLDNPLLIAAARINLNMNHAIKEGKLILQAMERPINKKTLHFIAQSQDLQMTRAEMFASPNKLYQMIEEEDEEEDDIFIEKNTRIPNPSIATISVDPLPNPWRINKFPYLKSHPISGPSNDLKQIFARELNALKKMGFTNEEANVNALSQTGGNIQLAARILQHKAHHL
jgi:hypothetical protein